MDNKICPSQKAMHVFLQHVKRDTASLPKYLKRVDFKLFYLFHRRAHWHFVLFLLKLQRKSFHFLWHIPHPPATINVYDHVKDDCQNKLFGCLYGKGSTILDSWVWIDLWKLYRKQIITLSQQYTRKYLICDFSLVFHVSLVSHQKHYQIWICWHDLSIQVNCQISIHKVVTNISV